MEYQRVFLQTINEYRNTVSDIVLARIAPEGSPGRSVLFTGGPALGLRTWIHVIPMGKQDALSYAMESSIPMLWIVDRTRCLLPWVEAFELGSTYT